MSQTAAAFHLLPANLGPLAELAGRESQRYSTTGVRLTLCGDNTYRAEVTDGRKAATVTGDCEDADQYPHLEAIASAPDGETRSVVPASDWRAAFKGVGKGKVVRGKPILANVAVVMGKEVTTLASTDLERVQAAQPRNVDGHFPDLASLMDGVDAEPMGSSVNVDARDLIDLLKAALAVAGDTGRVTLELRGAGTPVVVRARRQGQRFDGLLMPLT